MFFDVNLLLFSKESDFGKAVKVLSDKENEVLAILNENEKEVLEHYINAQSEINCITAKARFLYGLYKFPIRKFVPDSGFQIALDAMKEVDFDGN